MNRLYTLAFIAVAVLAAGCSVDVEQPTKSSVRKVKKKTLELLDDIEKTVSSDQGTGRRFASSLRELAECIQYLKVTLDRTGVGTDEDRQALGEIYYYLARKAGDPGAEMPAHLQSGGTPLIDTADMETLLPQIRRVVEGLPDSDATPPATKPAGN